MQFSRLTTRSCLDRKVLIDDQGHHACLYPVFVLIFAFLSSVSILVRGRRLWAMASPSDLNLEFEGRLLSRLGTLEDVPIVSGSVIIVMYPIKPPVSGESPTVPTAKFGPSYGENRPMPFGDKRSFPPGEAVPILPQSFPVRHHHPGLLSYF